LAAWAEETHRGQAQVSRDGEVTLTRTFRFFADTTAIRPAWGLVAIGINKYDVHPDDATCLAVEVTSTAIDGQLGWFDLSYSYTNRPFDVGTTDASGDPGQTDPTQQPNPTLRTPSLKYSSNRRMVPLTRDRAGKAVQNSARQPIEGLEVEVCTTVLTVEFAKGLVDVIAKKQAYQNKVNDAAYKIIAAHNAFAQGTLRCNSWDGSYAYEQGYGWFTSCSVEFEYNPVGWGIEVLDQGFYEHYNNGTQYVEQKFINTTTGMPVDSPQKLNGLGRKLNPNDNPAAGLPFFVVGGGTPAVSVYQTIYPYQETSFTNVFA
jgi:hypothetical protein